MRPLPPDFGRAALATVAILIVVLVIVIAIRAPSAALAGWGAAILGQAGTLGWLALVGPCCSHFV